MKIDLTFGPKVFSLHFKRRRQTSGRFSFFPWRPRYTAAGTERKNYKVTTATVVQDTPELIKKVLLGRTGCCSGGKRHRRR
jgi:hypothetical protein